MCFERYNKAVDAFVEAGVLKNKNNIAPEIKFGLQMCTRYGFVVSRQYRRGYIGSADQKLIVASSPRNYFAAHLRQHPMAARMLSPLFHELEDDFSATPAYQNALPHFSSSHWWRFPESNYYVWTIVHRHSIFE